MIIPDYKEMRLKFLKLVTYLRENINNQNDIIVSNWLYDIYEEGYFEGVRDYDKDDNRTREGKGKSFSRSKNTKRKR